jgi:hypothetical protein
MLRRPALLALASAASAATATAAVGLPAAAHAATPPHNAVFDVRTSATGTMKVHYHREDNSGEMQDETYNFDFSYESDYQDVRFVDGKFVDTGVRPIQDAEITLHDAFVVERWSSGLGDSYSCVDPDITMFGDGEIANDDFGSDVSVPMVWRPAERVGVLLHCHQGSPAAWHQGWDLTQPGEQVQKPIGQGPIDLRWDIPYEVLRMDHFEQLVEQEPFQKDLEMCPGFHEDKTVTCELTWSGKVIMDRVHEGGGGGGPIPVEDGNGDDVIVVAPPAPPAPAPAPPQPPAPPVVASGPGSTPTPTVGGARISRDRKRIAFTVACPAGGKPCSGTAAATGGRRTERFTIKPGARKTVTVALRKAARRGAKTTVRVTVGGVARTLKA